MKYLFVLVSFFSFNLFASYISFEIEKTKTIFNYFAIPNFDDNNISLSDDDSLINYRLKGIFDLDNGNYLYLLIAPLEINYNFISGKQFEFDGVNFAAGIDTDVDYQFNSYRLGYLWHWNFHSFSIWTGVVGKMRDAKIKVSQGIKTQSFKNVGFVPLASFGLEYFFDQHFSIFSHTDGLASSQGSAYDSQFEMRLNSNQISFSVGKRILGGGADNESIYTFSQFDSTYVGLLYKY